MHWDYLSQGGHEHWGDLSKGGVVQGRIKVISVRHVPYDIFLAGISDEVSVYNVYKVADKFLY